MFTDYFIKFYICDVLLTRISVVSYVIFTGCPVKLFRLGFLLFWQLLLIQIAKGGTFLQNSGNLLHNRHKNFENRFRNSWDNWGQSWQPSFRNWHFGRKIIFILQRWQLWPHLSQLFLNRFSKFLCQIM